MNKVAIKENSLTKVINETGVELEIANMIEKKFIESYEQIEKLKNEAMQIKVTDASQKKEMKIAKAIRLEIKSVRVASKKIEESLKEEPNKYRKAILNSQNLIESIAKPAEEYLELQEKFVEIQEQNRIAELKAKRNLEIQPVIEFIPTTIDLGTISETDYTNILNGAKLQLAAKIENEARLEKERLEKIEAERIENERIKAENERLRLEAIEKQKELDEQKRIAKEESDRLEEIARAKKERDAKRNSELKPYIVFIRDYSKMLELDEELYQKELFEIKKGAELQWEYDREKMRKEALEEQARQDAANKILYGSDKEKLLTLSSALSLIEFPRVQSDKANAILNQAIERIKKTIKTINEEAAKL